MMKIDEKQMRKQAAEDGVTHFCSGIAVMKSGKVLLVKRADHDFLGGMWELPGGGVDANESFHDSIHRELAEEAGLEITEVINYCYAFDYSTPKKPLVRQYNFLVNVAQSDTIILNPDEHSQYKWLSLDDLNVVDPITPETKSGIAKLFTHNQ